LASIFFPKGYFKAEGLIREQYVLQPLQLLNTSEKMEFAFLIRNR